MSLCTSLDKSMLSPCWIPLCAAVYVCVCERQMRGKVWRWGRKANVPDFEPFKLLADLECERKLKWTPSGFWWSPMGKFLSLGSKKLLRETCLPSRAQAQASSAAVANKQSPGCYHPGLGKLDSCWLHVRGETSVCSTTQSWEGKNFFPFSSLPWSVSKQGEYCTEQSPDGELQSLLSDRWGKSRARKVKHAWGI